MCSLWKTHSPQKQIITFSTTGYEGKSVIQISPVHKWNLFYQVFAFTGVTTAGLDA